MIKVAKPEELKILEKTRQMIEYGYICINQFPKAVKFSFGADIQKIMLMDDVVILHHDKKQLWQLKEEIAIFLENRLRLVLNNKTTVRTVNQGIDFCGYRIWPTHVKLRKSAALKMKKRLKYLQRAYARGEVGLDEVNGSVQSYLGLMVHCNSFKLRKKLFDSLVFRRL